MPFAIFVRRVRRDVWVLSVKHSCDLIYYSISVPQVTDTSPVPSYRHLTSCSPWYHSVTILQVKTLICAHTHIYFTIVWMQTFLLAFSQCNVLNLFCLYSFSVTQISGRWVTFSFRIEAATDTICPSRSDAVWLSENYCFQPYICQFYWEV